MPNAQVLDSATCGKPICGRPIGVLADLGRFAVLSLSAMRASLLSMWEPAKSNRRIGFAFPGINRSILIAKEPRADLTPCFDVE